MKAKIGLCLFAVLLCSSMAFAVNGTGYYNLITIVKTETTSGYGFGMPTTNTSTTMVLSQGAVACSSSDWKLSFNGTDYVGNGSGKIGYYSNNWGWGYGMWGGSTFTAVGDCKASVKDTPANLAEMLQSSWIEDENMHKVPLELGSDIDLGEFSSDTKKETCDANHTALPMMDSTSFNGNHFTVSHLCYAASAMKGPFGFFERASNVTLQNVKFNGVRIYIDGESTDGKDYYPVGALAGVVNLSTVDSIVLANDSIQAPFAGGLVGLVKNSTISNITGDDDILVSNKVTISTGYAGSAEMDDHLGHQVFLGGVAGAAVRSKSEEDPTFINDSLKVDIHDLAAGHKSALGGVVGLFKTIGDTLENLQVYTKYKEGGEVVPTQISGGASMGGIVGALFVTSENGGSKTAGNFVTRNSKFDGKFNDASSLDNFSVGGIVGFDSTSSGTSAQIVESYSKIELIDSLKTAGPHQYFAGGIVGYGGVCNNGSDKDGENLTIRGAKTVGSMALSASGSSVDGLHSDAYLGGIVGLACFARAEGMGLVNDTSSVVITSKVKTSVDKGKSVNGAFAFDSVFVGGIAGGVHVAVSNKADTLSGLYYDGSIVVKDSLNSAFVGGIVGGFTSPEGGKSLAFKNIMVNSSDLISYEAVKGTVETSNKQLTKIGGLCGLCVELVSIELTGVSGNIKASGTYSGDSLLVGGLAGAVSTIADVDIRNSFVVGDIESSAKGGDQKVGYLVGKASFGNAYELTSIYHYGDDALENIFGEFNQKYNDKDEWQTCNDIHYVVRNGSSTILKPAPNHQNGTVLNSSMQSSWFAGFLNKAYGEDEESEKDYVWTFVPGKNKNKPIFADANNPVIKPMDETTHIVVFTDMNGNTIKQETVTNGHSATVPTAEEIALFEEKYPNEGYTFNGLWNPELPEAITEDLMMTALYDTNEYTVKFVDYDDAEIVEAQVVKYLGAATVPVTAPAREGYEFVGWNDSSYMLVKSDLTIKATYLAKKYLIVFEDYNGDVFGQDSFYYDASVSEPVGITRTSTPEYEYTFVAWTPEISVVKGDATYKATYDSVKVKYAVTFVDYDETQIGEVQMVEYGGAAVAPEDPVREGYTFAGWDRKYDEIVKNTEVMARYERIPESSSSEESSSSAESSSSSEVVPPSSSSVEESSSSRGELKLVEPKIEQSGNAVRLTFDAENAGTETVARVVVTGENGVIVDTVISDDVVKGGIWEMAPAPMGKFTVELTLNDQVQEASFEGEFEIASEIEVRAESWQMVSLSALDRASMEGDDDASFYWWDEQNPVGDYWQYRAFMGGEADATRGFWYGTTKGKPLVLKESTGAKDSEIVWELDSLYSGWNLVANPYGWYVDLNKGAADDGSEVSFWRWNSMLSEYEVPTVIGPYEAVWAKAPHALTWRVSAAPVFGMDDATDDS